MKSHDYARKLKETAELLLSKPEFDTQTKPMHFINFYDKESFVAAVRALGSGIKEFQSDELQFVPNGLPEDVIFRVTVPRSKVCRLIQEAKYECEPILSQEELQEVGT